MATNDFLPFANGGSANVLSQSAYAALTSLLQNGFSSGVAQSNQLNKVWRQSSIMSAVLAQFISDRTGQNAVDDGTTATLLANLKLAAAALNGDSTQTFSVAPATQSQHAVQAGQLFGGLKGISRFTTSGTFTVPAQVTTIYVSGCAGGGGGGSGASNNGGQSSLVGGGGGGGGGAGQNIIRQPYTVTPGANITITIGAAGSGGAGPVTNGAGSGGTSGGNTIIGSLATLTGGSPGTGGGAVQSNAVGGGGVGGAAGSGFPYGGNGSDGNYMGNGGLGASCPFGGGGANGRAAASTTNTNAAGGSAGFGSGGGGGGAGYGSASAMYGGGGSAGSPGFVLIEW